MGNLFDQLEQDLADVFFSGDFQEPIIYHPKGLVAFNMNAIVFDVEQTFENENSTKKANFFVSLHDIQDGAGRVPKVEDRIEYRQQSFVATSVRFDPVAATLFCEVEKRNYKLADSGDRQT